MKTPKMMTFGEMPAGTHFVDRHNRKFIKLMTVLPSGIPIEFSGNSDGYIRKVNSIDYDGTPANCPDWVIFEILKK